MWNSNSSFHASPRKLSRRDQKFGGMTHSSVSSWTGHMEFQFIFPCFPVGTIQAWPDIWRDDALLCEFLNWPYGILIHLSLLHRGNYPGVTRNLAGWCTPLWVPERISKKTHFWINFFQVLSTQWADYWQVDHCFATHLGYSRLRSFKLPRVSHRWFLDLTGI
jgi:hypothetical protein